MSNLNKFNITEATMLALAAQKGVKYRFGDEGMRCMLEYSQALLALATSPVASGALPELPYEDYIEGHHGDLARGYTADQMRAYGQACAAAAAPNAALVAALEALEDVGALEDGLLGDDPKVVKAQKMARAALAQAGAA